MAAVEKQVYSRNKLVASLMRIKHDETVKTAKFQKRDNVAKLKLYVPEAIGAARTDADLFAHFIAWNEINGKVRDSKVAFPVIALRGTAKGDRDLIDNAIAHLLKLSPKELLRACEFSQIMTKDGNPVTGGSGAVLEEAVKSYLSAREDNPGWWDRTVLQHRRPMKRLYRLFHKKPSERADAILFKGVYPDGSVFEKVAKLKSMSPAEAAGVIIENRIPLEAAIGAVTKVKDKDVLLALLERMTGNQVITNTQMLQKFGVMDDPALKAAFDAALVRARGDKRVETLKAGQAAEAVKGTEAEGKLQALQHVKTEQLGSIEGDWLVAGDRSGSMAASIEVARKIAGLIAERVGGSVHLVFFNEDATYFDVSGKTYTEIVDMTRRVGAGGATCIGRSVDYIRAKGVIVNGIVVVSDGGENRLPAFSTALKQYRDQFSIDPTVYLLHVPGDSNVLSVNCARAGIALEEFELGREVDYYSLPNIVKTLRANRYALFEEIMATPLLTIEKALKQRRAA